MKTYYNYVIYHKKCPDGFTGFYILHQSNSIHKNAKIMPDVPSARSCPPDIFGDVIIIDVAYKYDILKQIINKAKSVLFIDHHITIRDDVIRLEREYKHKFKSIYNEKKSGATLVWDFLYPKKKHPRFIDLIEDNDTGTWKLKNVKEFITGFNVKYDLRLNKDNINKFKSLFKNSTVTKIINIGKIYNEYKQFLTNENSNRISIEKFPSEKIYRDYSNFFTKPGQYKVGVYCGSACPNASELAKKVLEEHKCDFFISWVLNLDRNEYVLTLRSEKVDVGSIAKIFNGGGHTYAAACSFKTNLYNIQDIFYGNSIQR
jgi:oligoribonuclease NrnB/cAMP/cGMP phosphodiesterase (DHH superfamily)